MSDTVLPTMGAAAQESWQVLGGAAKHGGPIPADALMSDLVPMILERKIQPKVWGGRALETALGIALPGGEKVGETWELYDRPDEGASRLRGSSDTVRELLRRDAVGLLGAGVEPTREGRFPLAIKFLDAAEALSVQVHPDDEQAAGENDSGKAEAWVVLHAGEKARVARGFRRGVTEEQFAEVMSSERVLDALEVFAPKAGDAVHLPSGTVHTIGPDVVVFEIQRNSDVTYRLFDWGRSRELHLEQGLAAVRFDREPETTVVPEPHPDGGEWLVRDPHFSVRRLPLPAPQTVKTEGSFKVLTLIAGRAAVGWRSQGEHDPLLLQPADSVLVPARVDEVFVSPVGAVSLLISGPGEGS